MGLPVDGSYLLQSDSNDNPLYEGWTKRKGASKASAIWKIKKYFWITSTGGQQVMTEFAYADGNELYDNIWNNRATTVSYTQAST